jgi:hypothetical protein
MDDALRSASGLELILFITGSAANRGILVRKAIRAVELSDKGRGTDFLALSDWQAK